jgi:hypothetical protein
MLPIPSLSYSGGTGGSAEGGDASGVVPISVGLGGFNVGGHGSQVQGGSASAAADTAPSWLWPALAVAGVVVLLVIFLRHRK